MAITALRQPEEQSIEQHLPGQDFSLIVSSNVLRYIKNLMIIVHHEESYSIKAYVGFDDDNRMHWLEEMFYSLGDVLQIAKALLTEHVKRNPYSEEEIDDIKDELESFDFDSNNAMSIMFPEI